MIDIPIPDGHNEPCYYCGKPCNSLAGDPGKWPLGFCHKGDNGHISWHHSSCVSSLLDKAHEIVATKNSHEEAFGPMTDFEKRITSCMRDLAACDNGSLGLVVELLRECRTEIGRLRKKARED